VSDAVTAARSARESLARGLSSLQSDPNIPPHLLELAEPVAQAMGALHQIEKSGGTALVPHAEVALNHVRTALAQLQAQPSQHPAVVGAMEAVAGSLGLVHSLTKMAQQGPPPQQFQQPQPPTAFQRPSQDAFGQPPAFPQQQPYATQPQPQYQQPPAPAQRPATQPQPQYPQQQQYAQPAARQADPFAQPPQQQAAPRPMAAAVGGEAVTADLGAHSPSNFYKGLAGNDIIDHGGLFVSTYKIPKIGSAVRLRVSLPGGYEVEANAGVRWSREPVDGGTNDAPPGFGAQFTEITPEARQLVYRYVRNREPLFHDDL
jgi:hypothetical protein